MNVFQLETGDTLSVTKGAGASVSVATGLVWVAQPADPRDGVLTEGRRFHIGDSETVLLYAFEASTVVLDGVGQGVITVRRRGQPMDEAPERRPARFAALRNFLARLAA